MSAPDPWNVTDGWWGTDGRWHHTDDEVRERLRVASGADEHPDGPPPSHVWFVTEGSSPPVWSPATIRLDSGGLDPGGGEVTVRESLPPDLPLGAHVLGPTDGGPDTHLFVVPERAPRPRRCWGVSSQLYATRSQQSWGHGDLADLAELTRLVERLGGGIVAHNPLGATMPVGPQQPSPYYASSRRFWSPLYLRVDDLVDRVAPDVATRSVVETAAAAGRALNHDRRIDRDAVWRCKLESLESLWRTARDRDEVRGRLRAADLDESLTRYATFCALAERHGSGWQQWPSPIRTADSPAVVQFRRSEADRVDFWRWVQLELERQLADAAAAGAPLMADLPVGFDPDGHDAWVDQDLLALGCRIGAPSDEFNPLGQDWGLPPYVPWRLRAAGYRPWIETLRRVLAHAGSLRIDHVMGLFRLYWIPEGAGAAEGGYVSQFGSELLDIAVMEAARLGRSLFGEDLGTVEPSVREELARRDVFGYRIGWFEDEAPQSWPAETLGSLSTHDLPTVTGLHSGSDAAARRAAGLPEDPAGDELLARRLDTLVELGAGDPHGALAAAGSDVVVVTLEDVLGVQERPNLPGTIDEHPNWRLALPVPMEELDDAGLARVAGVMAPHGR